MMRTYHLVSVLITVPSALPSEVRTFQGDGKADHIDTWKGRIRNALTLPQHKGVCAFAGDKMKLCHNGELSDSAACRTWHL